MERAQQLCPGSLLADGGRCTRVEQPAAGVVQTRRADGHELSHVSLHAVLVYGRSADLSQQDIAIQFKNLLMFLRVGNTRSHHVHKNGNL